MIIPPLFLTFCCSAIPISCHILIFFITCLCQFFSRRHMPELRFVTTQQQKSVLTGSIYQVLATLAVLAEELLTQTSVQTPSHRSKHSKSMDILHSFIHSGIFIFMILIRTYLSLFKGLVRLTAQRIH